MTTPLSSTTYVDARTLTPQQVNPLTGARGYAIRNPSGFALTLTDGVRDLLTVPPLTTVTGPLPGIVTRLYVLPQGDVLALGLTNADSQAVVTLYDRELPVGSAPVGASGPRKYSLFYTLPLGVTDFQLAIPAGYTARNLFLTAGVTATIQGVWYRARGSLTDISGTVPAEQTINLQTGAAGNVALSSLPLADNYSLTVSGSAGVGVLTLEGHSQASPVLILPHGAGALSSGGSMGNGSSGGGYGTGAGVKF